MKILLNFEVSPEQMHALREHHADTLILIENICGPKDCMYLLNDGRTVAEFFVKEKSNENKSR